MQNLLIGTGAGLFGAVLLWLRYGKSPNFEKPVSDFQRKLNFIRDICDGNLKKSNALLTEKMELDKSLSYEQAVDLVYADMLEITAKNVPPCRSMASVARRSAERTLKENTLRTLFCLGCSEFSLYLCTKKMNGC